MGNVRIYKVSGSIEIYRSDVKRLVEVTGRVSQQEGRLLLVEGKWSVTFADHAGYVRAQDALKFRQMAKAGAGLAAIMNTI